MTGNSAEDERIFKIYGKISWTAGRENKGKKLKWFSSFLQKLPRVHYVDKNIFLQGTSSQDRTEDGEDLWTLWGRIVTDWETYWKKQNAQIRELVRRGVPVHFRGIVWQLLCSATEAPEKKQYAQYIKVGPITNLIAENQ